MISFNLPLEFGNKIQVGKAWKYNQKWEALTREQFLSLTMRDLVACSARIVIEAKVQGAVCRVVTADEDYEQVRKRHPRDLAIHIGQIYKLFEKTVDVWELPRLLLPIGVLGATAAGRL